MTENSKASSAVVSDFEKLYLSLREKEGRLYADEMVRFLPHVARSHPLWKEWRVRAHSANRLLRHLEKKKPRLLVEVGCGNGWLTHLISSRLGVSCLGVDINRTEIQQAQRVFGDSQNVSFIHGDPLAVSWNHRFDGVIFASSIQYFGNLPEIIDHMLNWTQPGGEIHILDSPIYAPQEVSRSRERSKKYFSEMGSPDMANYYHHHCWQALQSFAFKIVPAPPSWLRSVINTSPFPWVIIQKQE